MKGKNEMNAMKKMIAVAAVAAAGFVAFAADEEGAAPKSSDTYSFTYQAALRDEHGLVISNGMSVARNQSVPPSSIRTDLSPLNAGV